MWQGALSSRHWEDGDGKGTPEQVAVSGHLLLGTPELGMHRTHPKDTSSQWPVMEKEGALGCNNVQNFFFF